MVIGVLTARLLVRESRSLKDKRQVVRSILERLRGQFNVGASEVDTQDDHRLATSRNSSIVDALSTASVRVKPRRPSWLEIICVSAAVNSL